MYVCTYIYIYKFVLVEQTEICLHLAYTKPFRI